MESKNCDHGIPDGVGCMICDTDGAVEACGFDKDCYISGGLPSPDGIWIEPSSNHTTKITASPSIPLAVITPRVEYVINPNPSQSNPPTPGLEVAFSSDNYLAVRIVGNESVGFVLSMDAALRLADLIHLELRDKRDTFNLAG